VVRNLFEQYDKGATGPQLAAELNRLGIPTARGGALWRANNIVTILRNPIYTGTGKYAAKRWITGMDEQGNDTRRVLKTPERAVTVPVPAIVSQELFDRVQAKLKQNQLARMAHAKQNYLLGGLIVCGRCGRKYLGCGKYYSCSARHGARSLFGSTQQKCTAPILRRAELEATVWDKIQGFLFKPGAALRELEKQMRLESHPLRIAEKIHAAQRERAQHEKKLERIGTLYIEGELTADQRRTQRERVLTVRAAIDQRIEALRNEQAAQNATEEGLANAKTVLEQLREIADDPSFEEQRKAVEALTESITVRKDGKTEIVFVFAPNGARTAEGWV
jgi:site-specific DNA recombinase